MEGNRLDRRTFVAAVAGGAVALSGTRSAAYSAPSSGADREADEQVRLGVASYSLRRFDRQEAIAMVKALGTPYINIKEFHLPYKSTPAELEAGRREFEAAGLKIVGGGTIALRRDDDDDIRFYFEYARRSGMPLMVIAPIRENLSRIERFVREYDIAVAIHNHGPEDRHFPAPQDALKLIRDMDPRMGVCVDLGHTARTGVDVVETLGEAGDRLLDIHMKDMRDLGDRHTECVVGEGAMPVPAIFRQLISMNYRGYVNLEYEIEPDDPLPGMKQSFAYMRGVLDGIES